MGLMFTLTLTGSLAAENMLLIVSAHSRHSESNVKPTERIANTTPRE
jgi:hypothetical protein